MLKGRTEAKRKLMWLLVERDKKGGSCHGTHLCARLRSQWAGAEGKHKANQLTDTFPVLVLSDEKKPKG